MRKLRGWLYRQDLCRAATNGEWKLPKHILLAMAVRHLYRSKQLTTILQHLGHCETYNYTLDLEAALSEAFDEASTFLTPQIVCGEANKLFHVEWDNLNKSLTNVHGSHIVNSAAGIMMQEVVPELADHAKKRKLPDFDKKKKIEKRSTQVTLPELHIHTRVGPSFPKGSSFTHPIDHTALYDEAMTEYHAWVLARMLSSWHGKQKVSGQGGFISATGVRPERKSRIDYFTPIGQPITAKETVAELLDRTEVATDEVGQEHVVSTFDLGVVMKACPIIWKFMEKC
ncbi:uncharacterized protein LOC117441717 [Xyrichtys novacula]|uniref:Uncharacterized protein LOC117441717 n=1 Tax=Xyrichtys novacula TaxID=13765 RepID=A0AAV1EPX6_XYRNO|nr:uncharacterized protein LOC117441717 [Xyrichtys novacula]